jgi:hypothetical protein
MENPNATASPPVAIDGQGGNRLIRLGSILLITLAGTPGD